jgi:rhamnogalacturonyl hydrolase YesR
MMISAYEKVKTAMLAVQRYPWEQGVCAQAMLEAGETAAFVAMARDAVLRATEDGRLASSMTPNVAVTDPAANGEAVLRAYELTGDILFKSAADKMLDYILTKAPRTEEGLVCHNEVSFDEGFSPFQIWADACYMLPPFLAVMGERGEAERQLDGYIDCLTDPKTGLLYHIYDAGTGKYVRKKLWATGNGWCLLGLARVIREAKDAADRRLYVQYVERATKLLDAMLAFQLEDGSFRDILDDETSFRDGTSSMMTAAAIYGGVGEGWLDRKYLKNADAAFESSNGRIDEHGVIHGVCGSPRFVSEGTSAEAQAAYIFMYTRRKKVFG